jgi:Zn-finger nucleic acid-binding protein
MKETRMQCPTDGAVLVMSERSGIEIDYCPTCRGVWLDRGELDKIIERAAREVAGPAASVPPAPQQVDQRRYDDRSYDPAYGRRKKKENWLSELFD